MRSNPNRNQKSLMLKHNRDPYQVGKGSRSIQHSPTRSVSRQLHGALLNKRARGQRNERLPFVPPEDWHEPQDEPKRGYAFVIQPPGEGYRHILTPEDVRGRLTRLPEWMVAPLQVVQFARMTRKKQSFPCYGMQWGSAIYLYPIETTLVEYYHRPPSPAQCNEARMFGVEWVPAEQGLWKLEWTEDSIRDFYLNNILIHELGHLLDERNTSYVDRERYAEWFAVEYGYKPTRRVRRLDRPRIRRHASKTA
jgi:hypothetical protein